MDNLKIPASKFYDGTSIFDRLKDKSFDQAGAALQPTACRAKQIQEAKAGGSYHRRVYSGDYVGRTSDGYMTLASFDQLGPRWVKDCQDVTRSIKYIGWYTDSYCSETLIGVVLCFTRHGADGDGEDQGKGRKIYMAGTRHSNRDGVTLGLDITDNPITAAHWADQMAEREAESCREEDEKFQREQRAEEIHSEIKDIRARCLKLLRDMRPLRKGLSSIPEPICEALRTAVRGYVEEIATLRGELERLK